MLDLVADLPFISCFSQAKSRNLSYLVLIAVCRLCLAAGSHAAVQVRKPEGKKQMLRLQGLSLVLGAGLASVALAEVSTKFDGQYRGELILTKEIKENCTQPPLGALYPLRISKGEVRFVYVPRFDTTLWGTVDDNGALTASARLKHGSAQMTGHVQGNRITAYIVTPSCHYTFQTKDLN